jgi:predicted nucleic acid-binding protein
MILVDTSVWISHFRDGSKGLSELLEAGEVMCHQLIIGELACGNLKSRNEILSNLELLPMSAEVQHDEIMSFIEKNRLMGRGLGYIDVALAASALLSTGQLWTLDKKLMKTGDDLGILYTGKK